MDQAHHQPLDPRQRQELCDRASRGDRDALERLLWSHHARLTDYARRKIGVDWRGTIDPEDLLQEAYIYVFQHAGNHDPQGVDSFYHWVTMVVDRRFIDRVRHARRQKRDVARQVSGQTPIDSNHGELLDRCVAANPQPSRILRREEAIAVLMTCIAQLPEDYQMVVRRHFLDEEPLPSIAAKMDKSVDAVRRMARRAVERLSRCVGHASDYLSSHG